MKGRDFLKNPSTTGSEEERDNYNVSSKLCLFCVLILFEEFLIAKGPKSVPQVPETIVLASVKGNLHLIKQFGF